MGKLLLLFLVPELQGPLPWDAGTLISNYLKLTASRTGEVSAYRLSHSIHGNLLQQPELR